MQGRAAGGSGGLPCGAATLQEDDRGIAHALATGQRLTGGTNHRQQLAPQAERTPATTAFPGRAQGSASGGRSRTEGKRRPSPTNAKRRQEQRPRQPAQHAASRAAISFPERPGSQRGRIAPNGDRFFPGRFCSIRARKRKNWLDLKTESGLPPGRAGKRGGGLNC